MLMRQIKKEREFEKAHMMSLAAIAATFLFANLFLVFGFSSIASAQTLSSNHVALELAQMLAAPDISVPFNLMDHRWLLFAAMGLGLTIMSAGSIAFLRGLVSDAKTDLRTRF